MLGRKGFRELQGQSLPEFQIPHSETPLCGFLGHQERGRYGQSQPSQKEAGPTANPVGVCAYSLVDHVSNLKKEDASQQTHQQTQQPKAKAGGP